MEAASRCVSALWDDIANANQLRHFILLIDLGVAVADGTHADDCNSKCQCNTLPWVSTGIS